MKRRRRFNPTHIDGLPKDLIQKILMCLPIQDAVRTSILSRKWRYVWTGIPELVFDDNFCEESIMKTKSTLIKAISQVILLHQGPLNKFKLSVSYLESSCSEIDQFILVALRKGVRDLTLNFQEDEPYRLPLSVFSYGEQLTSLKLECCVFKPPSAFNGFSKLETLWLDGVVGITGRRLSTIFSHCPVLESLIFVSYAKCTPIDIAAPNLKHLVIDALYLLPLCFKDSPKLSKVEIYSGYSINGRPGKIEVSSQSLLCGRLPVVEELVLDACYLEYVASKRAPALLVRDLRNLKMLSLLDICFGLINGANLVSSALCLIRNCPHLEMLEICVYTDDNASEIVFAEAEDVSLDRLKRVELRQVSGLKCELQFIKFILAKSLVLEKFLIVPDSDLVGEKGLKFFRELSTFRRASPLVEMAYEV